VAGDVNNDGLLMFIYEWNKLYLNKGGINLKISRNKAGVEGRVTGMQGL
jgi:hypothetical protein